MKTMLVIALAFSSFAIVANEAKNDAPKEVLTAALKICKQYATEDGIEGKERHNYLLECVNDELYDLGYKKLVKLDLDENEEIV